LLHIDYDMIHDNFLKIWLAMLISTAIVYFLVGVVVYRNLGDVPQKWVVLLMYPVFGILAPCTVGVIESLLTAYIYEGIVSADGWDQHNNTTDMATRFGAKREMSDAWSTTLGLAQTIGHICVSMITNKNFF